MISSGKGRGNSWLSWEIFSFSRWILFHEAGVFDEVQYTRKSVLSFLWCAGCSWTCLFRLLRDKTATDDEFVELCRLRRGAALDGLGTLLDLPVSASLFTTWILFDVACVFKWLKLVLVHYATKTYGEADVLKAEARLNNLIYTV